MLPLLKKGPDKADSGASLAWHPDFRLIEALPDTKVVRTSFFVNAVSLVAATAALLAFAYREYEILSVNGQAVELEEQVARDEAPSRRTVELYRKFQADEAKVKELEAFLATDVVFSEFLLKFSESLPLAMAARAIDLRDGTVTFRGVVKGAPDEASGMITAHLDSLRADDWYKQRFAEILLASLARDPATGLLNAEIQFRAKNPKEVRK
jgi:hypothetical protein